MTRPARPRPGRPLLVLDTASPQVSVALGTNERVAAARVLELHRSSELLLRTVDEMLRETGRTLADLGGVAALQGPGSFTGLRIGLATVLGWHQALGLPATALPTLDVLAAAGGSNAPHDVVAAVDALRGDWYVRRFRRGEGVTAPGLVSAHELPAMAPCRLVGFGVSGLGGEPWWNADAGVELVEPPPLAPLALALAASAAWKPERLSAPIYFRPPAVTAPEDRKKLDRRLPRC